ncbi:MAG: outer membrane beta-barrel protein [Chlorobiaceae bacterium]
MKKLLLTLAALSMAAAPASAATSTYVSGSVGLGLATNTEKTFLGATVKDMYAYKTGVPFVGAVGIKSDAYRLEAALGYQVNDVDKAKLDLFHPVSLPGNKVSMWTYMANAYYDIDLDKSSASPYVTVGLGGASLKPAISGESSTTKSVFAWQAGAGVALKASDVVVSDLGYRYLKPLSVKTGGEELSFGFHNLLAGVRYCF